MQRRQWVAFGPSVLELDAVLCLAGSLGVSQVEAAGYVALVVAYGIAMADDDGRIDHLTDKAIEQACYWEGERGCLVEHFIASNVLAGDRESDTSPLRIEPSLWDALAGKAMRGRETSRRTSQKNRDNNKTNS